MRCGSTPLRPPSLTLAYATSCTSSGPVVTVSAVRGPSAVRLERFGGPSDHSDGRPPRWLSVWAINRPSRVHRRSGWKQAPSRFAKYCALSMPRSNRLSRRGFWLWSRRSRATIRELTTPLLGPRHSGSVRTTDPPRSSSRSSRPSIPLTSSGGVRYRSLQHSLAQTLGHSQQVPLPRALKQPLGPANVLGVQGESCRPWWLLPRHPAMAPGYRQSRPPLVGTGARDGSLLMRQGVESIVKGDFAPSDMGTMRPACLGPNRRTWRRT